MEHKDPIAHIELYVFGDTEEYKANEIIVKTKAINKPLSEAMLEALESANYWKNGLPYYRVERHTQMGWFMPQYSNGNDSCKDIQAHPKACEALFQRGFLDKRFLYKYRLSVNKPYRNVFEYRINEQGEDYLTRQKR